MRLRVLLLAIFLLAILPVSAQDEVLIGEAMVSGISVDSSDGIVITITGELPDACTEIGDITQNLDDDTIRILVQTTRPADSMCAAVITPFEISYTLDTSDIPPGAYTLDVNGVTETVTIVASADAESAEEDDEVELTCPEADDETTLYDDNGVCFLYPANYDELDGGNFIIISQPLTANALLIVEIRELDEDNLQTLDDVREQLENDTIDLVIEDLVIGRQDALVIENDDSREAFMIVHNQLYHFIVQPIADEGDTGEFLWATVIDSLVFLEDAEIEN